MERVKPITLGIIALLLILLVFNFVPKEQKSLAKDDKKEILTQQENNTPLENNATLTQNNIALIQKNIDFLKENIELLKAQNTPKESMDSSATQTQKDAVAHNAISPQKTPNDTTNITESSPIKSTCKRTSPQLAIIIDDVNSFAQIKAIQNINYKITPSIFPRSKDAEDTPKLAPKIPFYMVHLPLEAQNFYQKGHQWLFVGDSKEKMEKFITQIKEDFPNLSYINNHTGSKFTQDKESMDKLLQILAKHSINFLDSKTATNTATSEFYATHKNALLNPCQKEFLQRDIFLDNELDIAKITKNLIDSVKLAKQKGYAIAIAHPHKETFLALKNAESFLKNSGVELVYVNEIITP